MTGTRSALDRLFNPETVAVIGASDDERKKGGLVLRNLQAGFEGRIFPVHPTATDVGGLETYRTVASIPTEIDLLIPLIPAADLLKLVYECPPDRVNALLAIPAGFGEIVPDGGDLQNELIAAARDKGMRVVGPNTAGLLNCGLGLNASLTPGLPRSKSGLSCVTQSGGFGMAVYMYGLDHGLEVAKFCDLGNTSDVTVAEVLDYYRDDPDTESIGIFLESHPETLDEAITAAAAAKPLILTTLGRTEPGRRSSRAHIGLPPGRHGPGLLDSDDPTIAATTGLELLDIAKALSWQPRPRGRRAAIVTGSGGLGTELADLCVEHGLDVPELSPALQDRLRPHLPSFASVVNPVDLTPAWLDYPVMYPPLMTALLDSDEIDLLIVTIIDIATTVEPLMRAVTEAVAEHRRRTDRPKPVLVYWAAPPGQRDHRQLLQAADVPCYPSTLTTARVAAAITQRSVR